MSSQRSTSSAASQLPHHTIDSDPSADLDDVDDMRSVMLEEEKSSSIWVPLSLFGSAVALASFIVLKGRGDGRGLGQRIMEARVAAQATTVAGLIAAAVYSYSAQNKPNNTQNSSAQAQRRS